MTINLEKLTEELNEICINIKNLSKEKFTSSDLDMINELLCTLKQDTLIWLRQLYHSQQEVSKDEEQKEVSANDLLVQLELIEDFMDVVSDK